MRILKLEYRNFNSYGNKPTVIEFNDAGSMIMLIGQSGHGKSSIREVISFLIYGKVQDKKLGDLPNRVNKALWGKITLSANNSIITIERGIAPKIFNVTIDGEPKDVAGNSNIQNIIEEDYMKIPQSTFDNVISISVDKFKSFLTMRPADKRKILDQIFGILFFNKIHDSLKDSVKDYTTEIKNLEGQVNVLLDNKKVIENKIKSIDIEKSKDVSEKLEEIVTQIDSLNSNLQEMNEKSKSIQDKSQIAANKLQKLNKSRHEVRFNLDDIDRQEKIYESEVCPTCHTHLVDDIHIKYKEKLQEDKQKYNEQLESINEDIVKVGDVTKKIESKKKQLGDFIFNLRLDIDNLKGKQSELSQPKEETNEFDSVLKSTIDKIDSILSSIEENKKSEYLYLELSKIFGEDGVKLHIMKSFLPSFNKSINEISKKLHFPYKIEIDEKFNSKLLSIGEEINPKTLSTGERKKADFAVLISLIHIMKRNYPNINLLFLDEILASIDSYGVYEMLSLIRTIVDELDLNVFVINHSELPKEMFDYIYSVNKVAGFSELETSSC